MKKTFDNFFGENDQILFINKSKKAMRIFEG